MTAVLQGFDPVAWPIHGSKTAAYRQVGNAFPPPVAKAFGERIREALLPRLLANYQVPRATAVSEETPERRATSA
jgi:DNA (cytosine-5)-methyltransferase 1